MSEKQEEDLVKLFGRKLNIFMTISLSILGIFIALFITFMIKSSSEDGIQNTQISQLVEMQKQTNTQIDKIVEATNILITEKEVKQAEYNNLLELLQSTNDMAQKTEWAVLTGDKSIITRDTKIKK